MNPATTIKLVSIEGRWGQSLYPSVKSLSIADLLRKEQSAPCAVRPYAAALLVSAKNHARSK